ncbi:multidrug and toxin extrusion protein 1-like [Melanotaenia boesemani]|uniref:multidrug and toxin extrusion protein 1-like n=1 Tax=Melanotaenia boesemani TaxID=1250792 RepID=UPI001C0446E9|nr:multidrug and toxin extrusion protein 1-like [Melanotaenia boesemani]
MDSSAADTKFTADLTEASSFQDPGKGCGSRGIRGFLLLEYRNELVQLIKLAGPVVFSQLMVFMISIISLVFCGHLGKTELAGVSLAAAVVNVTGISIGTGLSTTCDTLISQTYGSGNLKRIGVILQRGVLILLLACFPCWALLINTEPILLAVKQSPEVASLAQLYVKIFMPALPAAFMYQLQGKYLQNQGIMWPQVITGTAGNVLNAIINYIFLYPLELGVAGSAAANVISQYFLALFLYVYICWRGLHKATWGGWSLDCLQEWGLFIKLAIPSMLMICLSWWIFEIGGFLAGVISEVELGAQSIAYQLCIVAYMCPLGFSVAASVRVGNALGAGNTKQAKLSCKVPIICACSCESGGPNHRRKRDILYALERNMRFTQWQQHPDSCRRWLALRTLLNLQHVSNQWTVCNLCSNLLSDSTTSSSRFSSFPLTRRQQQTRTTVMDGSGKTKVSYSEKVKVDMKSGEAAPCVQDSGEGWGSCLKRIRGLIPPEYRNELVQLFKLAGPVVISQMMIFMISFVSMVFCGHLGKTELAGVSLSVAVVNVTGISIGTGLSLTCDTLISQTYGGGNLKRVGVILQRGILILLLACFPCWAVLINTEPLLLAVRQSPDVARLSQLYVNIFMPALPAAFMYQLQGRYLQNQGIIWPQVITGAIGNVVNAIINYVFLYYLELGVAGSAAANAISQYSLAVVLFIYIYVKGLHKSTWGGWSLDCLQEWGPFIHLAIPSMLMLCLEWWIFEVGGFLAGVISEAELGAQSIVYELAVIAYMFPLGFSAAASVRVGNALGAGNVEQAKLSCKLPIICAFIIACFVGATLCASRTVIGYIFTTEPEILERVADVMIIFGFTHLADAVAAVNGGVLRGVGKQLIGALCNLVGFYFIGFPIGVTLMFAANMGIVGLWTGLTICVLMQAIFFIIFVWRLDWKKVAEEALVRAGVQNKEEKDTIQMEEKDCNHSQTQVSVTASGFDEEDHTYQEAPVPAQNKSSTTTVGDVLSVPQLVLRRGLTLLVMIITLAIGIVASIFLTDLLK